MVMFIREDDTSPFFICLEDSDLNRSMKLICRTLVFLTAFRLFLVPVRAVENEIVPEETAAVEFELATVTEPTVLEEVVDEAKETEALEEIEETTASSEVIGEEVQPQAALHPVPVYFQTDYPDIRYGSGSIATSGCSVTSLAMVATYLTGHTYMPDELADYFSDYNSINHIDKLEYMSDMLQLPWERAENFHVALRALKEGKIVISLMSERSLFTTGQHFIVWTGINENGKIMVNDPNVNNYSVWNLESAFKNGFNEGDLCCGYSGAWIYDPDAMPEEPYIYIEEREEVECRYPGVELTLEEQNLLARMVWVEAQGEPFEGQQAVAEVVLNRLVADGFQNSIHNVIYAENQFRSVAFLEDAQPVSIQYEAIERALEGPYVLPIDVVYFATYPVNGSVWGEIGGHVFCYQ